MRPALLVLFVLAPALAAPVPKVAAKKSDAELLEGKWVGVTLDTGGGPQPATQWRAEIKDGKLSVWSGTSPGYQNLAIKLDPTASPKCLDIDATNGSHHLGLYELDGDTLTWCETSSTTARPTALHGKGGGNCFVFKRDTAEKK